MPGDYATIQKAMDAAAPGDTVFVAPGTYTDVNEFELAPGWTFTAVVIMKPGVTLLGHPDAPEEVVIQAADSTLGIACLAGDSSTVVAGVTVTGGQVGLMGRTSSPLIHHCRFVANGVAEGNNAGGGLYGDFFSPTVRDCEIADNASNSGAGATFANDSGALVIDCAFADNAADSLGGAVWLNNRADVVMRECTLSRNTAAASGGAFFFRSETSLLATDCLFSDNAAAQGADGFLEDGYDISVELVCCGAEPGNWAGGAVVIDDSDCD